MRRQRNAWRTGGILSVLALSMAMALFVSSGTWNAPGREPSLPGVAVRRTNLDVALVTGGRVDSAEKTIIECKLHAGVGMPWGSAAILSLLPEGSLVKEGDVLCTLDSARYEETYRLHEIVVSQARADYRGAELNLEIAKIALQGYRDGLMKQTLKGLQGTIALRKSDYERARDRLQWSKQMLEKGYAPKSQISSEQFALAQLAHALKTSETDLKLFETYSAPKYIQVLEAEIFKAQAAFDFQTSRLATVEERLEFYQKQLDACQIRAPHDGFLIYYTYPERPDMRIEEGTVVHQTQKLFFLPDLNRMEVNAMLHESVVKHVQPGMKALIEVEGLPGRKIQGHVASIEETPTKTFFSDVRYFIAKIKIDEVPPGLKPGMTASVKLETFQKADVLVIPSSALALEEGQEVCYLNVEGSEQPLRREVEIGQSNDSLIEIKTGLNEGDEVVLNPLKASAEMLTELDPEPASPVVAAH